MDAIPHTINAVLQSYTNTPEALPDLVSHVVLSCLTSDPTLHDNRVEKITRRGVIVRSSSNLCGNGHERMLLAGKKTGLVSHVVVRLFEAKYPKTLARDFERTKSL